MSPIALAFPRAPKSGKPRVFVLDTNVLLHDPSSLYRFEEHGVYIPLPVLEELDDKKKGVTDLARNARAVARELDRLVSSVPGDLDAGIPLNEASGGQATGRLFLQVSYGPVAAGPHDLSPDKTDNKILMAAVELQREETARQVIVVSKDINVRLKARTLGLATEDYFNDQVVSDADALHRGLLRIEADKAKDFLKKTKVGCEHLSGGGARYTLTGAACAQLYPNLILDLVDQFPLLRVVKSDGRTAVLDTLKDYSSEKHAVFGVTARNTEQNIALNFLCNPHIDLVTLLGPAGTGKTFLTIAAGLAQVFDEKRYAEIMVTRATIPVGEEIGFLPGTEEEKMAPWLGALDDSLEVLTDSRNHDDWGKAATAELVRSKVKIKSISFMRGRTFLEKWVVIDEAQNLTPKQIKTLITRAGSGAKVILMGNLAQIDTPYLSEGASGLAFAVERFKGWPHAAHITLSRGERSRLADYANDHL